MRYDLIERLADRWNRAQKYFERTGIEDLKTIARIKTEDAGLTADEKAELMARCRCVEL